MAGLGGRPCESATFTGIDWSLIDLVIVLAAVIGLANGYRRGLWLSLSQYLGMVAGVVAGAALAPRLLSGLNITGSLLRPLGAVLILIVGGSLGSTFGYWLGDPLRRAVAGNEVAPRSELVGGAVISGVSVLLTSWFLGITFDRGPSPEVSRLIQRSGILRALDSRLPPPPGFLAGVEAVLSGVPFQQTFAGLEPTPRPLTLPGSVDTPGVRAAEEAVFKVEGRGCGGLVTGSAYPVAPGYFITNAHVVSGTTGTQLTQGSGLPFGRSGYAASVVYFDSRTDVAILHAPGLRSTALAQGSADHGTQGAVIGYPGGGPEMVSPAAVDSQIPAQGRDIYNDGLVSRDIYIVQAAVRPGNSGGPLVDLNGHVLGLVFAASSTNPDQAYALTNAQLTAAIQQGVGATAALDPSGLGCAV